MLTNEVAVLRSIRLHTDSQLFFSIRAVPQDALNHEFRELIRRGYIKKESAVLYQITDKGLDALHLADVNDELEEKRVQQLAQQAADDRAYAEEQERAHDAKVESNQRKQFAHDFKVAAFSIAGTLLVEHFDVVLDFICEVIEKVSAFLH